MHLFLLYCSSSDIFQKNQEMMKNSIKLIKFVTKLSSSKNKVTWVMSSRNYEIFKLTQLTFKLSKYIKVFFLVLINVINTTTVKRLNGSITIWKPSTKQQVSHIQEIGVRCENAIKIESLKHMGKICNKSQNIDSLTSINLFSINHLMSDQ